MQPQRVTEEALNDSGCQNQKKTGVRYPNSDSSEEHASRDVDVAAKAAFFVFTCDGQVFFKFTRKADWDFNLE